MAMACHLARRPTPSSISGSIRTSTSARGLPQRVCIALPAAPAGLQATRDRPRAGEGRSLSGRASCSRWIAMNRFVVRKRGRHFHDVPCRFGHTDSYSLHWLPMQELIDRALPEDVGDGDVTTEATVDAGARGVATITQKAPGVISGLAVAEEIFR